MSAPGVPENEAQRLEALRAYGEVELLADASLDALVRVAAKSCEVPIALVSLVDDVRQRFVANVGLPGVDETPREFAFCAHALVERDVMIVPDASRDPRFSANPLVTGEPAIRFYAGSPLVDEGGFALGTLCVIDRVPRKLSPTQESSLRDLAAAVTTILAGKKSARALARAAADAAVAAAEVQRRNELLALSEEMASFGHWRLEVGTSSLFWSPQIYRIHGLDPASFVPELRSALDAYHPDDRASVRELVRRAVEHGEAYDFDLRIVRPDGEIRRVHSLGCCELGPDGKPRALFGVLQDITEREHLREHLVRQERLATIGTLAAGVGHEINNPLTFIASNVEHAIEAIEALGGSSPSAQLLEIGAVLQEVRDGAERIRKIVRGLRAFAREDAAATPTDVASAIHVSVNMASHELRPRASLELALAPVPKVLADEAQLAQVFVNLLVNAAQAFPRDDPEKNKVIVTTSTRGGDVVVEVTDNGPGVPTRILSRIFDPFFTTKAPGQGTGLGLSISQSVIASLGGQISCESTPRGATFRVVLPAAAADPGGPPHLSARSPSASAGPRGRVMVIDDEPAIARILERLLGSEHDVVCFVDAREARAALAEDSASFSVVFCDLTMPHVSGMTLHRETRELHPLLAARFVFMTGGAMTPEAQEFLTLVENERIEKPFTSQNVRAIARRFAALGPARA